MPLSLVHQICVQIKSLGQLQRFPVMFHLNLNKYGSTIYNYARQEFIDHRDHFLLNVRNYK